MLQAFTLLKRRLCLVGFIPYPNRGKALTIIARCFYSVIYSFYIVSTIWFLLFDAESLIEYTDSFYFVSVAVSMTAWYSIYFFRINQYLDLMKQLDAIVAKSELKIVVKNSL